MAVSVDTVYQRVLAIANKEQRGYVTPQEFNLLANQAQMQIFESYFYTKNSRERLETNTNPELDETNISELIAAKLNPFRSVDHVNVGTTFKSNIQVAGTDYEVFQTGRVFFNGDVCHKVSVNEASRYKRSVRHIATTANQFPIYCDSTVNGEDINVFAGNTVALSGVTAEYFRVPVTVNWGYVIVANTALYNANVSVDFELHKSEEDTLVNKILSLAGIITNKPGLSELARLETANETQSQTI